MNDTPTQTKSTQKLERLLAVIGTVLCLVAAVLVWQVLRAQQPVWPLPGLYLLEMLAASILGTWSIWNDESRPALMRETVTWVTVGILYGFVIVGTFSVGLWFAPAASLIVFAAILSDLRQGHKLILNLSIGLVSVFAQAALMLAVIRLI